mgnify:CR=1 FL=1
MDMQESLERADISEQALAKFRARGRSMSAAPRDVEIPIQKRAMMYAFLPDCVAAEGALKGK